MKPRLKPVNDTHDISPMTIGNRVAWRSAGPGKGRGVFALVDFKAGDVIECSPVTLVPKSETDLFDDGTPESDSVIDQYLLRWQPNVKGKEYCLGHGFLMLYNHHGKPSGRLNHDYGDKTISMIAGRDIKAGEEITFDYDCELWFDAA